ncbi:MAG: metal-binding protein [Pseudanabaena sp.]|nr:MAG: metal-binding protein [Pseudanabaena sp.]
MKEHQFNLSISLGDYAHQVIHQNFQKVIDQEKSVFKDQDIEPLHQMRVGMRRLRTAIQVFGNAISLPKEVNNSSIGKIARSLGETRDLDVLQQTLIERYQPLLTKAEESKFVRVIKHLQQKRDRSFLKLKKMLNGDRYQTLKQAIQDWLIQPNYTMMANLAVLEVLPDLLLPLICRLFLHSGWLVGTTIQSGKVSLISIEDGAELNQQLRKFGSNLHDLRKHIKGVRYQTEFFSDFYEDAYAQRMEEFITMQEMLGQLQDHVVLSDFLESALKEDLGKSLPTIAQIMREESIAFWQSWQPLQEKYLSPEFRKSLRSILTTPLVQAHL